MAKRIFRNMVLTAILTVLLTTALVVPSLYTAHENRIFCALRTADAVALYAALSKISRLDDQSAATLLYGPERYCTVIPFLQRALILFALRSTQGNVHTAAVSAEAHGNGVFSLSCSGDQQMTGHIIPRLCLDGEAVFGKALPCPLILQLKIQRTTFQRKSKQFLQLLPGCILPQHKVFCFLITKSRSGAGYYRLLL